MVVWGMNRTLNIAAAWIRTSSPRGCAPFRSRCRAPPWQPAPPTGRRYAAGSAGMWRSKLLKLFCHPGRIHIMDEQRVLWVENKLTNY